MQAAGSGIWSGVSLGARADTAEGGGLESSCGPGSRAVVAESARHWNAVNVAVTPGAGRGGRMICRSRLCSTSNL